MAGKRLARQTRTPILAYVNCSAQDGQYFGLEEYRAAATNAHGGGADGVYLFNYPCLFELAMQRPGDVTQVPMSLIDLRTSGQRDFSRVAQALDELGEPASLAGKNKRYQFYCTREHGYRHQNPEHASLDRADSSGKLTASFRFFEDTAAAKSIALKFKLENTVRSERFALTLNGQPIPENQLTLRYAPNGRDTRMHTVTLGPYLEYEAKLQPEQLKRGENVLEVSATKLQADLKPRIYLLELEVVVSFA